MTAKYDEAAAAENHFMFANLFGTIASHKGGVMDRGREVKSVYALSAWD